MTCSNCSAPYSLEDKFCGSCGQKLDLLICPSCRNPVSQQDKFCGDCGFSLKRKVQEAHGKQHTSTAVELNNEGLSNYEAGNYRQAIHLLNQSIQQDPMLATAYCNRGLSFIKLGKFRSALSDYDQAIHLDPHNEYAYFNRGTVHLRLGNKKKARQDFETTLSFSGKLEQKATEHLAKLKSNPFGWPFFLLCALGGAALSDFILNIEAVQNFGFSGYIDNLFDRIRNLFQQIISSF